MKRIAVLGATGSIGRQALELIAADPELHACALASGSHDLAALAAHRTQIDPWLAALPAEWLDRPERGPDHNTSGRGPAPRRPPPAVVPVSLSVSGGACYHPRAPEIPTSRAANAALQAQEA